LSFINKYLEIWQWVHEVHLTLTYLFLSSLLQISMETRLDLFLLKMVQHFSSSVFQVIDSVSYRRPNFLFAFSLDDHDDKVKNRTNGQTDKRRNKTQTFRWTNSTKDEWNNWTNRRKMKKNTLANERTDNNTNRS
jgi:hypothetical protein